MALLPVDATELDHILYIATFALDVVKDHTGALITPVEFYNNEGVLVYFEQHDEIDDQDFLSAADFPGEPLLPGSDWYLEAGDIFTLDMLGYDTEDFSLLTQCPQPHWNKFTI